MMDLRAVAKRMADYNEWRRGSYDVPPPDICQLGLDIDCAVAALQFAAAASCGEFALGDRVTKRSGSSWTGRVVGVYSTALTPIGYAVESETERGSVQIYPEKALARAPGQTPAGEAAKLREALAELMSEEGQATVSLLADASVSLGYDERPEVWTVSGAVSLLSITRSQVREACREATDVRQGD